MKKAITIYSAGAAEEVTGSRHYIEYNNKKYQIDCGAFQGGADADKRNKTAELKEFNEHISICIMREIQVFKGIDKLIEALEIPNSSIAEVDLKLYDGVKEKSFCYRESKFIQLSECDGTYL